MADDADRFRKQAEECREQEAGDVSRKAVGSKAASIGGLFQSPPRWRSLANRLDALPLAIPRGGENGLLQSANLIGSGVGDALGGKHAAAGRNARWHLRHNTGYARNFANALRVETLSKRCKDCKMPPNLHP
jgi:hypothetical protein